MPELSHLSSDGAANMVDVSAKPAVIRQATATAFITLQPDTLSLIRDRRVPKGEVLATARIAGIQAAKQTQTLIPLCHQIPLSKISIDFEFTPQGLRIVALVKTIAPTGVEMEALTAAALSSLTIYDMCKAVDRTMEIRELKLLEKIKDPMGTP